MGNVVYVTSIDHTFSETEAAVCGRVTDAVQRPKMCVPAHLESWFCREHVDVRPESLQAPHSFVDVYFPPLEFFFHNIYSASERI